MKSLRAACMVAMATAMCGTALFAADMSSKSMSVSGYISDSKCGAAHMGGAAGEACIKKCVAGGEKPVFVDQADKTVWAIDNPAEVAKHLGHHVTVSATENAATKTMHITKVTMLASKSEKTDPMDGMSGMEHK